MSFLQVSGYCQSLWKALGLAAAAHVLQTGALGSHRLQHLAEMHDLATFFFPEKQRHVSLGTMTIGLLIPRNGAALIQPNLFLMALWLFGKYEGADVTIMSTQRCLSCLVGG